MSETGIEFEKGYAQRAEDRAQSAWDFLLFFLTYTAAVAVVLMDLLVWRPD